MFIFCFKVERRCQINVFPTLIKSKTGAWEFLNNIFQMAPDLFTKHYLVPQIELQAIGPLQFPTTQIHVADYNK